jgi:hypothetical protein
MAAGQRKFIVKEIRFTKDGADIRCDTEFSWGIEESDGQVHDRRGNTTSFGKAELIALLTAGERSAIVSAFAKIQTAVKAKVTELANAVEE